MFKRHYKLFLLLFTLTIAIGWITLMDIRRKDEAAQAMAREEQLQAAAEERDRKKQEKLASQDTFQILPTATPAPEPTAPTEAENAPSPTPAEPTPTAVPKELEKVRFDYCLADVEEVLNIRSEASDTSSIVGKLGKKDYAKIVDRGDVWYKIVSGDVTGYVHSKYIFKDKDAVIMLRDMDALNVKITATDVNIRSEANTTCEITEKANKDSVYAYYPEYSTTDFYAIKVNDKTCFVSKSYSEVSISLSTAKKN